MPEAQMILGNCMEILPTLPVKDFQVVMTSPPFWPVQHYALGEKLTEWPEVKFRPVNYIEEQFLVPRMPALMGTELEMPWYIGHVVHFLREVRRTLRDDGICWFLTGEPTQEECSTVADHLTAAIKADGWYVVSEIMWNRQRSYRESLPHRPKQHHDRLLMLAKSRGFHHNKLRSDVIDVLWSPSIDSGTFADFSPGLVQWCLEASIKPGCRVLDPMAGTGAVGRVAFNLGCSFLGIEMIPEDVLIARRRLSV